MKSLSIILIFIAQASVFAQNLVRNPSFEEYKELPCTFIDFQWPVKEKFNSILTYWELPTTGTSDVYSLLVPDFCPTYPNSSTELGAPTPKDGNNMIGIYIAFNNNAQSPFHYREYVQVELTEKLTIGKRYVAGFYQCRANLRFGSNNIGMLFTTDKVALDTNGLLNFIPQINNKKIENIRLEWVLFNSSFVATEESRFLTIGNFYKDEETEFIDPPRPQESHSYYFIDSVFVQPFYDPFIPNIITPNGDKRNDVFFINGIEGRAWELKIYNRWGQRIYYSKTYQNNWNGDGNSPGVYYYHLKQHEIGVEYKGTLSIN